MHHFALDTHTTSLLLMALQDWAARRDADAVLLDRASGSQDAGKAREHAVELRAAADKILEQTRKPVQKDGTSRFDAGTLERSYDMAVARNVLAGKFIPPQDRDAFEAEWVILRKRLQGQLAAIAPGVEAETGETDDVADEPLHDRPQP